MGEKLDTISCLAGLEVKCAMMTISVNHLVDNEMFVVKTNVKKERWVFTFATITPCGVLITLFFPSINNNDAQNCSPHCRQDVGVPTKLGFLQWHVLQIF